MKQKFILVFLTIISFSITGLFGQLNPIDSLHNELRKARHDTTRIKINIQIGSKHIYNKPDSAIFYLQRANNLIESLDNKKELNTFISDRKAKCLYYKGIASTFIRDYDQARDCTLKSIEIYEKLQDKPGLSDCYNSLGNLYYFQGVYSTAVEYYEKSLTIRKELGDQSKIASCYNNLGVVSRLQGSLANAIEYYQKSLKISEELEDTTAIGQCYNNIGIIYRLQGLYAEALDYQHKALKIHEEAENYRSMGITYNSIGGIHHQLSSYSDAIVYYNKALEIEKQRNDKRGIARAYDNIGNSYRAKGSYSLAIEHYKKALKINEEFSEKYGISLNYSNLGMAYQEQGQYAKAIDYHLKSLKIKEELGTKNGIAHSLGNLADINIRMGQESLTKEKKNKYYRKALEYSEKALEIAKELNALLIENFQYKNMHTAYSGLGDFKKAYEYSKLYIKTNDSLFNEDKAKIITEIQTKYETVKKQQEIENQRLIIEQQESDKQKQVMLHYLLGIIVILLLILIIVILFAYRNKRLSHNAIEIKNNMLEQANEEINAQKDELTAQRDTVVHQNKRIEQQKEKITNSINYAKVIQKAVLPSDENINKILKDYFIIYKPKEIVSGDFYWVSSTNGLIVFSVADCTGHGVPGAFMSMLGLSFLNEIVSKKGITQPNIILDLMRESVIEALQQKGRFADQSEGINMSLCTWDTANNKLYFAGAKNPIIIIKDKKTLKTIPADKQPIATHKKLQAFTLQEIQLEKGDKIYLSTDGFHDQFGGQNYQRFKRKNLKDLLLSISDYSLQNQKEILDKTFEDWKGDNEQIDDVTIMAIKV
ncbi:MAG: tetratricopeptide repeat protein [Bacteroidota bacterium]